MKREDVQPPVSVSLSDPKAMGRAMAQAEWMENRIAAVMQKFAYSREEAIAALDKYEAW